MLASMLPCFAWTTDVDATTSDPIVYLNKALDEMQQRALRRDAVNWQAVRAQALAQVSHAQLTVDTYDAIRFALRALGDHHSSLHLTPALERIQLERKGRSASGQSDSKLSSMGRFVGRYEPEGKIVTADGKPFAVVVVTKCFPDNQQQFVAYETELQRIVAKLDGAHPAGWVVDLRGNVGGNMWPMLAGIGPLLGEGDHLGEFFTTSGHSVWKYRDGIASEVEDTGKENRFPPVAGAAYKISGTPAVAVLIDRWTGSSGEAIAIALCGRPNTRFFGEHTQGASTANETFALSDGASMWLTIGVDADRTGKQYLEGLAPDEWIKPSEKTGPDEDAVLEGALRWLGRTGVRG